LARTDRPTSLRHGGLAGAGCALLLAAAAPAPALADDASAARAWCGSSRAFALLNQQEYAADVAFNRADRRARGGPLLSVQQRRRLLIVRTRQGLLLQRASTATGAAALSLGLRSLALQERMTLAYAGGVRAFLRGNRPLGHRLFARGNTLNSHGGRDAGRALALFRQAGAPTTSCVPPCPTLKAASIRAVPVSRASACRRPAPA
jgi:hypothetical protein